MDSKAVKHTDKVRKVVADNAEYKDAGEHIIYALSSAIASSAAKDTALNVSERKESLDIAMYALIHAHEHCESQGDRDAISDEADVTHTNIMTIAGRSDDPMLSAKAATYHSMLQKADTLRPDKESERDIDVDL